MTLLNAFAALIFGLSAAVQFNDPDPVLWIAIYGLAVLCCVASHCGRLPGKAARLAGIGALLAAVLLGGAASSGGDLSASVMGWSMVSLADEQVREAGGLMMVGFWLLVLSFRQS